jgi:Flp pilus assembly protein TadB
MTCLFSIIYISLVVALMWWCRKKRSERNSHELQSKNEIDDTASDVEEGQVRIFA